MLRSRRLDLSVVLQRQVVRGNNLNPVSIGIQNKSNVLHSTLIQLLLELDANLVESLTGSLNVVDSDGQMSETLGLGVSVVVGELSVVLSAPVVGQLKQTLTVTGSRLVVLLEVLIVRQEVESELCVLVNGGSEESHAQLLGVELNGLLGVLDSQHGVVESVRRGVGLISNHLGLLVGNQLDPVSIGVQSKGNVLLSAVRQLLLELDAALLQIRRHLLNVVDREANVAKASVGLHVSVVELVISLGLSAVVVGQLKNSLTVPNGLSVVGRLRVVVGKVVNVKLEHVKLVVTKDLHAKVLLVEGDGGLGILDPQHGVVEEILARVGGSHCGWCGGEETRFGVCNCRKFNSRFAEKLLWKTHSDSG